MDQINNDYIKNTVDIINQEIKTQKTSTKTPKTNIPVGESRTSKSRPHKVYDFTLGPREGNTRIVGPDGISVQISGPATGLYSSINILTSVITNQNTNKPEIADADGYIGNSNQRGRGDCYFLSEINGIRNTEQGQKILKQNVKLHKDGSITITLPGAVAFRNKCIKQGKGDLCEVTGTYHITPEALEKAKKQAGNSYSSGDIEVIALEIAMENFRAEMTKTNENLGNNKTQSGTLENSVRTNGIIGKYDYLSSGESYDAGFLLTGQKSDVYRRSSTIKPKPYKDGQFGYITVEEMERRTNFDSGLNSKGMATVNGRINTQKTPLDDKLDKYRGKENEYALTYYVQVPSGGYHALTVVKITDDVIYTANPWHPDKIEPIPRKEFEKMAVQVNATNVTAAANNQGINMLSQIVQGDRINQSVSPHELHSFQNIFNRFNSNHTTGNHHQGQTTNISPDKLTEFLSAYNRLTNNNNHNQLLRMLSNLSSSNTKLSDEENEKLQNMFSKLTNNTDENISERELKDLNTILKEHFSN